MIVWKWLLTVWRWFVTVLHESGVNKLRTVIDQVGVYDLHDILRRRIIVEWCEWHLNINENDKAIEIAEKFHHDFAKLELSSSIAGQIDTIEETFLKFMPTDDKKWDEIRKIFKEARYKNSPILIIKAYTLDQRFSERLNKHSAVNTYHALKLYCTLLNCPILAQTQEYTEAFTRILFHPKLKEFLVRNRTVYRGIVLEDKKLVENYKKGATIITTTFLSTSNDREVAESFCAASPGNTISIFCTYNINITDRHTALDLRKILGEIGIFKDEEEILILRYVPFTIKSVDIMDDGRRMEICFDECKEHCTVEETHF
jgi:hypothetical protein